MLKVVICRDLRNPILQQEITLRIIIIDLKLTISKGSFFIV